MKRIVRIEVTGSRFVVGPLASITQRPVFWAIADDDEPTVERQFAVLKAGDAVPSDGRYLGTFLVADPFEPLRGASVRERTRHMTDFKPRKLDNDPVANAILNLADQVYEASHRHAARMVGQAERLDDLVEGVNNLARAVGGLLYGLKYGEKEGMSIAEAIEVAGNAIADKLNGADE